MLLFRRVLLFIQGAVAFAAWFLLGCLAPRLSFFAQRARAGIGLIDLALRMKSYKFWFVPGLLCIGLVLQRCDVAVSDEIARPNVVIIYTDDQGYGDAGCYNAQSKFSTPNIDALAAGGVRFTDGHSSDSVCSPSRYGLLTGRYCWRTELKRGVLGAEHTCLIPDSRPTVATLLSDAGYATTMVGKWHLGMDFPGTSPANRDWTKPVRDMPLDKGFDKFFGIPASLNYGVLAWFDGRFAAVPPTVFTAKKPNKRHVDYRIMPPYQTVAAEVKPSMKTQVLEVAPDFVDNACLTKFTDRAVECINEHVQSRSDQPFLLYLPLTSPHYPVCPLPQFHGQGDCGGYGEFMIETDYHVGRVVEALRRSGVFENTMVIFSSDNGAEKSWKQRKVDFQHASNGALREGKRSVYEGGHRVPFVVHWPAGIVEPGRTSDRPVCQTDIFATCAELIGVTVPDGAAEDSESFLAALRKAGSNERKTPLIHHSIDGRFAIRDGDWKLVMPKGKLGAELYNVVEDLSETRDLASDKPKIVNRLTALATSCVSRGRVTDGPAQPNDTGYWGDLTWMSAAEYGGGK